mmetsp:Transcript_20755/g.65296  ORF Transcript_20755/g.65296 Transcript_20755/m.65296 type:complete len:92 (-) Transcript_20755:35-310(-)
MERANSMEHALSYQSVASLDSPRADRKSEPGESSEDGAKKTLLAVIYGVVATAMCAPVMMSFASIIFADRFFAPFMPSTAARQLHAAFEMR